MRVGDVNVLSVWVCREDAERVAGRRRDAGLPAGVRRVSELYEGRDYAGVRERFAPSIPLWEPRSPGGPTIGGMWAVYAPSPHPSPGGRGSKGE